MGGLHDRSIAGFFLINAMSSVKAKPLGAKEVILEFQTHEDMVEILGEGMVS